MKEYSEKLNKEVNKKYNERTLDVRNLREKIKSNEYERLPFETRDKLIYEEK